MKKSFFRPRNVVQGGLAVAMLLGSIGAHADDTKDIECIFDSLKQHPTFQTYFSTGTPPTTQSFVLENGVKLYYRGPYPGSKNYAALIIGASVGRVVEVTTTTPTPTTSTTPSINTNLGGGIVQNSGNPETTTTSFKEQEKISYSKVLEEANKNHCGKPLISSCSSPLEEVVDNECVSKKCDSGYTLNDAGSCVTNKKPQTITFGSGIPSSMKVGESSPVPITATSTSGLLVTLTSDPYAVCQLDNNLTLKAKAVGTCTITATQGGDSIYAPIQPPITKTITVNPITGGTGYSLVTDATHPNGYPHEECVRENATGLVWEGKTAGGDRDGLKTYTNIIGSTNADNSFGYVKSVNDLKLCGRDNWRLPTTEELLRLVKQGVTPSIDTAWFKNTPPAAFWSSTPDKALPNYAELVYFNHDGVFTTYSDHRSDRFNVRLVSPN